MVSGEQLRAGEQLTNSGFHHSGRIPKGLAFAFSPACEERNPPSRLSLGARGPLAYYGGFTFAALVAALVLVHALLGPPAILSSSLLVWVGKRSYGLYVWHWPVYLLVAASAPEIVVVPACIIGTFCFAAISFRYIEKPFLDLKRRRSSVPQTEVINDPDNAAVATI